MREVVNDEPIYECGTNPCPGTGGRCQCCGATGLCYKEHEKCVKNCKPPSV